MEFKEFVGKTVEEALTQATVSFGVTSDHVEFEVIEKGSTGLFGIGSKDAVIRARIKSDKPEMTETSSKDDKPVSIKKEAEIVSENPEESSYKKTEVSDDEIKEIENVAESFLTDLFKTMNLEVSMKFDYDTEDNSLGVDLQGPEMGIIIGKRGQTLDSLQYLTNLVVNRKASNYTRVKIDTEDYRNRRKETLENLAKNVAFKVKKNKRPVSLEAMNPYERRIIHSALSNDDSVLTHSEGEEPYRHVVVTLKK